MWGLFSMLRLLKWLVKHLFVKTVNLNDDKEGKPHTAVVVGIEGKF